MEASGKQRRTSGAIGDCKTNVRVSLFRANFERRFVSGHDFSRAERASRTRALAPAALLPSPFGFGQR